MTLTASIVVVGANDPGRLRDTLSSLETLATPPVETLVIDASTGSECARLTAEEFPRVAVVNQPRLGTASSPLWLGCSRSTADVVVFLEAGSVVQESSWLDELLAPYADTRVSGVGGRVVPQTREDREQDTPGIGMFLPNGAFTKNFSEDPGRLIEVDHLPASNMSFRRGILSALLNASEPNHGTLDNDAVAACLAVRRTGGALVFQPSASVHYDPTHGDNRGQRLVDQRTVYRRRRDHLALLVRSFGWRNPVVLNYIRTTTRDQGTYLWLTASHMRSHKLTGERRSLATRLRALWMLTGIPAELIGLPAGAVKAASSTRRIGGASPDGEGHRELRARSVVLSEITVNDEQKWQALCKVALEPNPFLDPRFLMSAARCLPTTTDIRLVIVEDGDQWLAVMPLSVVGRFAGMPLRYASTAGEFLGKRASLCTPLIDAQKPDVAASALLRHLASRRSRLPGLIEITLLPDDGPVAVALRRAGIALRIPVQERSRFARAYTDFSSGVTSPDHFSTKRKKQFDRKRRGLERELGAPIEFISHESSASALTSLLILEAAGWKGSRGGILNKKGPEKEWFLTYMDQFIQDGDCRIFELRSGETTAYMSLSLISGNTAFGTIDAYNEDFRRLSPGMIGRVLEQQALGTDPLVKAFDPCTHPKYADATALYPDSREMVSLLLGTRFTGRIALRARPFLRALLRRNDEQDSRADHE